MSTKREDHAIIEPCTTVGIREDMNDNVDQFLALMEKYVDIPELTPTIVNEFMKQVIVYAPDKSSGKRTQKIKIVFNSLEEVEVPEISEPVMTETTYIRQLYPMGNCPLEYFDKGFGTSGAGSTGGR